MADDSFRDSVENQRKRLLEVCCEHPEFLATRVYQLFDKWEEITDADPKPARGVFRPSCGSKLPQPSAFEIRLTAADLRFLREMRIAL
jgi:hypothetical protein